MPGGHRQRARVRAGNAVALRLLGQSYPQIATTLGYASRQAAHAAVRRSLRDTARESADEARLIMSQRLDALLVEAWSVIESVPPVVNGGRVVLDADGAAVLDMRAKLDAIKAALLIEERRAKLLGTDAPAQAKVSVITEDMIDQRIAELTAELEEGRARLSTEALAELDAGPAIEDDEGQVR